MKLKIGQAIGAGDLIHVKGVKNLTFNVGLTRWPRTNYVELRIYHIPSTRSVEHLIIDIPLGQPKTYTELAALVRKFVKTNIELKATNKDWLSLILQRASFFFEGYDANGKFSQKKALADNPSYYGYNGEELAWTRKSLKNQEPK